MYINIMISYILIGILLVGMVAMMVIQGRNQKKAQNDYQAMLDTLRVGVKVKMVSGLLGRIKEIREEAPGFKTVVIATTDDKNAPLLTFVMEAIQGIVNEEAINKMNAEKIAAEVDAQANPTGQNVISAETVAKTDDATPAKPAPKKKTKSSK